MTFIHETQLVFKILSKWSINSVLFNYKHYIDDQVATYSYTLTIVYKAVIIFNNNYCLLTVK